MAGGSLSSLRLGQKIVVIGLFVQIVFFGFFIIVALSFDFAIHKVPTPEASSRANPWHKHLSVLYLASIIIMIRSIFRVVEYIQGNDGYILRHEYFLYVFDAILMLAVMVVFQVVHPSEVKAMLKGGKFSRGLKLYTFRRRGSREHRGRDFT